MLVDGIPELGPEMAHLDEQLLPAEAPQWISFFSSVIIGLRGRRSPRVIQQREIEPICFMCKERADSTIPFSKVSVDEFFPIRATVFIHPFHLSYLCYVDLMLPRGKVCRQSSLDSCQQVLPEWRANVTRAFCAFHVFASGWQASPHPLSGLSRVAQAKKQLKQLFEFEWAACVGTMLCSFLLRSLCSLDMHTQR